MFTKGNFFRYFYQTVLLTSATTSSSWLQTLSTTIAPPVMQYLCECHTYFFVQNVLSTFLHSRYLLCLGFLEIFTSGFFVVVFYFFSVKHLFLSEKKTSICLWEAMPPFLHPCRSRVFSPGLHICTTQC